MRYLYDSRLGDTLHANSNLENYYKAGGLKMDSIFMLIISKYDTVSNENLWRDITNNNVRLEMALENQRIVYYRCYDKDYAEIVNELKETENIVNKNRFWIGKKQYEVMMEFLRFYNSTLTD